MKKEALASYLECEPDELEQANWDKNLFEFGMESYLVLTDEESYEYARGQIMDSLWTFDPEFIMAQSRIEIGEDDDEDEVVESLRTMLQELDERANPLIKALLKNPQEFADAAIAADGRAHFLGRHDGKQIEVICGDETLLIYRQN